MERFSSALDRLTFNCRPDIMKLTAMANELQGQHAGAVVKAIEDRIQQAPRDQKLPCLYLMDSIVKNHPQPYKKLFEQGLIDSFSNTFAAILDISARQSMYKLRITWKNIFPVPVLQRLDIKIRTDHDTKWPLINPPTVTKTTTAEEDEEARVAAALRQKELEVMILKNQKLELEVLKSRKTVFETGDPAAIQASISLKVLWITSRTIPRADFGIVATPIGQGVKKPRDPRVSNPIIHPEPSNGSDHTPPSTTRESQKRSSEEELDSPVSKKSATDAAAGLSNSAMINGKRRRESLELVTAAHKKSKSGKSKVLATPTSVGWAKLKADNADEFHTADIGQRSSCEGQTNGSETSRIFRRGGLLDGPRHPVGRNRVQINGKGVQPFTPQSPFSRLFHFVSDTDPTEILSAIIPQIVTQAQQGLKEGKINQDQFSELMKQVLILKEQAMMKQADRRHHEKMKKDVAPVSPALGTPGGPLPEVDLSRPPPPMPVPFHPTSTGAAAIQEPRFKWDLPNASEDELELIRLDPASSINIDNFAREIRFYGEVATSVMAENDIRELSFQANSNMSMHRVFVDGNPSVIPPLRLNVEEYFTLEGVQYSIKIGGPTRELILNGQWYQCYFGKRVCIPFGQKFRTLLLEGPPPIVSIGEQRADLCAGFVYLVIDGDLNCQKRIFLDAKPQILDIGGKQHVLRFAEGLQTLLINSHPFKTDFGGVPLVIFVHGEKHYLRLTSLPRGVRIGQVKIWGMSPALVPNHGGVHRSKRGVKRQPNSVPKVNENSQEIRSDDTEGQSSAFDRLLRLFPSMNDDTKKSDPTSSSSEYSVQATSQPAQSSVADVQDLGSLWSQLLGAGLVNTSRPTINGGDKTSGIPGLDVVMPLDNKIAAKSRPGKDKHVTVLLIKEIVFQSHHKSLKKRQQGIVDQLYDTSALQCKNCGLRYLSTDMMAYSQHLDWHFRVKRREKDNAKRAQSRKWYFEQRDWIISEEIEDEDKDALVESDGNVPDGKVSPSKIPTVPVSDNKDAKEGSCPVCQEEFDQIFKEDGTDDPDDGRWHYHNAIRPEEDEWIYHPQCYQDRPVGGILEESLISKYLEDEHMEKSVDELSTAAPAEEASEKEQDMEISHENDKKPIDVKPDDTLTKAETDEVVMEHGSAECSEMVIRNEIGACSPSTEATTVEAKTEPVEPETNLQETGISAAATQLSKANIRINITSPVEKVEPAVVTDAAVAATPSEFDVDAVIQGVRGGMTEEQLELKPKLRGKKLTEFPPKQKDTEMSGLCSIM